MLGNLEDESALDGALLEKQYKLVFQIFVFDKCLGKKSLTLKNLQTFGSYEKLLKSHYLNINKFVHKLFFFSSKNITNFDFAPAFFML